MKKCERVDSKNLPLRRTRGQGFKMTRPKLKKSLKPPLPGWSLEPLRRLAQQDWKNLHHLPYSTHLSIGTSSIRIWQSRCFLRFVAGQVFEYWLLAADNGSL